MTTTLSDQYLTARLLAGRAARRRDHRRDLLAALAPLALHLLWLTGLGCGIGLGAVLLLARLCCR